MDFIKKNYKYMLLFVFLCFINYFLIYSEYSYDTTWEYGMSHAITLGQLPYKDFTLVTTPLFIFLFSIGLFIKDNLFVFILEFIISYLIMYYFLDKLIGNNKIIILLMSCVFLFNSFVPTYNSLCLVFIVILMYLEKNNKNDYLIGFILGLLLLTKHSIGLSIIFFSFIGIRNIKRIGKRLVGIFIPCLIFTLYLLITKSLNSFIDLCFLGMLDFGSTNSYHSILCRTLTILIIGITVFLIFKNKKEILLYYVLGSVAFVYPINDLSHFTHLFTIFFIPIVFLYNERINLKYIPYILIGLFVVLNALIRYPLLKDTAISNVNHFDMTLTHKSSLSEMNNSLRKMKKYSNNIIVAEKGSFYYIALDKKMDYFTIPHTGNYGYDGTNKMIKRFDSIHDKYVFVDIYFYNICLSGKINDYQYDLKLIDYIMNNSKYVDKVEGFNIYYKE